MTLSDPPSALDRPALVIRRVDAIPVALPLVKPVRMAAETVTHARNILVRIEAADGAVGWGEAASAPTMTGDTLGGLTAAVRDHLGPALIGADAWMRPALMKRLRAVLHRNPGAHSAVEMALLDLAGQASGLRLIDLVGGPLRREVAPMWLIGNATPDEDVAEAKANAREGIRFFKLKVGVKPLSPRSPPRLRCARRWGRMCRSAPMPIAASRIRRRGVTSRRPARLTSFSWSSRSRMAT